MTFDYEGLDLSGNSLDYSPMLDIKQHKFKVGVEHSDVISCMERCILHCF